jgi:long-chain fatty acid transport protein
VKTRFGIAYDKSPVKAAVDRTMTLPDSDRTWLSFGVKYSLSKESSLDIGYSHIFFKDARTAKPVPLSALRGGVLLQTINGKWDRQQRRPDFGGSYNHNF